MTSDVAAGTTGGPGVTGDTIGNDAAHVSPHAAGWRRGAAGDGRRRRQAEPFGVCAVAWMAAPGIVFGQREVSRLVGGDVSRSCRGRTPAARPTTTLALFDRLPSGGTFTPAA